MLSRDSSNCWRSGQSNGVNGRARGDGYNLHSSNNCPHVLAKRDQQSGKSAYHPHSSHHASSPRNSYGDTHNTYHTDRPDRDYHHKNDFRSGVQSSASSVASSMRSQTTQHYDHRSRDRSDDSDRHRDNRDNHSSRSRDRDRDSRDRDHRHR